MLPRLRVATGASFLALAACRSAVLDPAGPIGSAERTILLDSLAIMLCIVVPVIAATIVFACWFRAGNARAVRRPDWVYSGRIEIVTWAVPLLVILFLGGIAWASSHALDPARPLERPTPPLEVQVVSLDWKWLFIYPGQGVASVNQLMLPVGVPVHLSITSASVMNTFFVPRLGSMIYSMNGMATQLNLRADRPGDFLGESGHFSGDGFSGMRFVARAVPPAQFEAWARQAQGRGPALDAAHYALLERQSEDVVPFTYGAVAGTLFDAIVAQRIPPAPGPRAGRGGPAMSPRTRG